MSRNPNLDNNPVFQRVKKSKSNFVEALNTIIDSATETVIRNEQRRCGRCNKSIGRFSSCHICDICFEYFCQNIGCRFLHENKYLIKVGGKKVEFGKQINIKFDLKKMDIPQTIEKILQKYFYPYFPEITESFRIRNFERHIAKVFNEKVKMNSFKRGKQDIFRLKFQFCHHMYHYLYSSSELKRVAEEKKRKAAEKREKMRIKKEKRDAAQKLKNEKSKDSLLQILADEEASGIPMIKFNTGSSDPETKADDLHFEDDDNNNSNNNRKKGRKKGKRNKRRRIKKKKLYIKRKMTNQRNRSHPPLGPQPLPRKVVLNESLIELSKLMNVMTPDESAEGSRTEEEDEHEEEVVVEEGEGEGEGEEEEEEEEEESTFLPTTPFKQEENGPSHMTPSPPRPIGMQGGPQSANKKHQVVGENRASSPRSRIHRSSTPPPNVERLREKMSSMNQPNFISKERRKKARRQASLMKMQRSQRRRKKRHEIEENERIKEERMSQDISSIKNEIMLRLRGTNISSSHTSIVSTDEEDDDEDEEEEDVVNNNSKKKGDHQKMGRMDRRLNALEDKINVVLRSNSVILSKLERMDKKFTHRLSTVEYIVMNQQLSKFYETFLRVYVSK